MPTKTAFPTASIRSFTFPSLLRRLRLPAERRWGGSRLINGGTLFGCNLPRINEAPYRSASRTGRDSFTFRIGPLPPVDAGLGGVAHRSSLLRAARRYLFSA